MVFAPLNWVFFFWKQAAYLFSCSIPRYPTPLFSFTFTPSCFSHFESRRIREFRNSLVRAQRRRAENFTKKNNRSAIVNKWLLNGFVTPISTAFWLDGNLWTNDEIYITAVVITTYYMRTQLTIGHVNFHSVLLTRKIAASNRDGYYLQRLKLRQRNTIHKQSLKIRSPTAFSCHGESNPAKIFFNR